MKKETGCCPFNLAMVEWMLHKPQKEHLEFTQAMQECREDQCRWYMDGPGGEKECAVVLIARGLVSGPR